MAAPAALRVAFAGTPGFARVAFDAVERAGFDVVLVLTQPDRPAGRGLKLAPSPVKAFAAERGRPVVEPRGLRLDGRHAADAAAARDALAAARPDAMVVAAYGLILPPWALALPRLGCLNVHASLLPRWRGAAPIHRAIEAGDAETGVTIMQMDEGLDTGPMLRAERLTIEASDTTATLQARLALLGGRLVVATLDALEGGLTPEPQPASGVTYAHKIDKAEAAIDWRLEAGAIERRLRAFDPFPGSTAVLEGETVKCWRGTVCAGSGAAGEVIRLEEDAIVVACGSDAVALTQLQRAGGRRLTAAEFLRGRPVAVGARFAAPAESLSEAD